jgi:hypothetical protein
MSANPQDVMKDAFEIYHRLFDHSAAIRGEINFFFNNFKDGDDVPLASPSISLDSKQTSPTQLETLLHSQQVASEAADVDWQKVVRQSEMDKISVKMDAAATMMEKLIERGRNNRGTGPYGDYMEKSKQEQRRDLQQFGSDIQKTKHRVDEEYREKIDDLKRHFDNLALQRPNL